MDKTGTVINNTRPGRNNIDSVETGANMNSNKTMNNDGPRKLQGKIDIISREKQINANSMIYYIFKQEKNLNKAK